VFLAEVAQEGGEVLFRCRVGLLVVGVVGSFDEAVGVPFAEDEIEQAADQQQQGDDPRDAVDLERIPDAAVLVTDLLGRVDLPRASPHRRLVKASGIGIDRLGVNFNDLRVLHQFHGDHLVIATSPRTAGGGG